MICPFVITVVFYRGGGEGIQQVIHSKAVSIGELFQQDSLAFARTFLYF